MDILFKPHHLILNEGKEPQLKENEKPTSSQIAYDLNKTILRLYGKFLSEDGGHVDYSAMKSSEEFAQFSQDTAKLKLVQLATLNEDDRKCFFLNCYNALVIHGYLANGVPVSMSEKMNFFKTQSYRIGPNIYSLDDMEHGILRENRKHPSFLVWRPQFGDNDPRKQFIVKCDRFRSIVH